MRHGAALVVDHADTVTIVGSDGLARRFEGASADLVRVALEFWSVPHTEQELVDHLRGLAGDCEPALVAETAECLRAAGAIRAHEASSGRAPATNARGTRARIVLGVSGAIAGIDAPALVRMLQARRFDVSVVMTAAARRFVSPAAFEALTHRPVIRGFWHKDAGAPAPHIQLATWADLVVLYPATAATIARIAQAACTDVLSALVTATTQPVLVVPSMNESMYRSPGVQRNLEQLRRDGRHVVQPGMGLEAAVAPSARAPMAGAAPPPSQVIAAIELLAESATLRKRAEVSASPVVGADAWDRQYGSSPVGDLPWFTEQLDAVLARELRKVKKGRLLDVGTGPGTAAIFAARNGFEVVATDVSSTALGIARRRANGEHIAWVLDDVLDSRLWGRFDVLVDRGCLHCLPKSSWPDYARAAGRLVEPGGTLVLKLHAPEEAGRHGTHPADPDELRVVFGEWFTLAGTHASEFDGTIRPSPKALLVVMTRQGQGRQPSTMSP